MKINVSRIYNIQLLFIKLNVLSYTKVCNKTIKSLCIYIILCICQHISTKFLSYLPSTQRRCYIVMVEHNMLLICQLW